MTRFLTALLGATLAFAVVAQSKKEEAKKVDAKKVDAGKAEGKSQGFENSHAMCIGCHGIPGYKTAFPDTYHVPKIAGQKPAYIVAALKAYKSGERSHPSMRGIAASLSDEDMKQLAEFYGGKE